MVWDERRYKMGLEQEPQPRYRHNKPKGAPPPNERPPEIIKFDEHRYHNGMEQEQMPRHKRKREFHPEWPSTPRRERSPMEAAALMNEEFARGMCSWAPNMKRKRRR